MNKAQIDKIKRSNLGELSELGHDNMSYTGDTPTMHHINFRRNQLVAKAVIDSANSAKRNITWMAISVFVSMVAHVLTTFTQ